MENLKIRLYISQQAALARSQTRYGKAFVEPTEEQLASLTSEQRAVVGQFWQLHADGSTWEDALAAINREVEKERAEAEARERRVLAALAEPLSAWVTDAGDLCTSLWIDRDHVWVYCDTDPRLMARRAEAEPLAFARRNEIAARKTAEEAEYFRLHNEYTARQEQYARICREYVREYVPEFARAAADGCDVSKHAEKHALQTVVDRIKSCDLVVIDGYLNNAPLHACPSQFAYSVLDTVTKALTDRELPALIASATPKIVRDDTCGECKAVRTCVQIDLAWRDGDTGTITVYADTEEPHVHEE